MTARVLIGKFPAGGYGLRISKDGYSVLNDPPDNEQMIFNSDWTSSVPIHAQGVVTAPVGTTSFYYFPNLPYVPFGLFYRNTSKGMVQINNADMFSVQQDAPTIAPWPMPIRIYTNAFSVGPSANRRNSTTIYYTILRVPAI